MQVEDEKLLLNKVSEGNEIAFGTIFNYYRNKIYGYALTICQSQLQAEEIVQNVFLQIWINRAGLRNIENFAAYVRIMARNEALQFLRRLAIENRHQNTVALDWTELDNDTEQSLHFNEAKRMLDTVLDALPPQQKLVYNMCHLQGMKQQEVAAELHISPLTVKAHLRQAVKKVRKAMFIKLGAAVLLLLALFA